MDAAPLRTARLLLTPMTEKELLEKAASETDAHMKAAYGEMHGGVTAHPESAVWYTEWRIGLPGGPDDIGGAGFKGPPDDGETEIGYGIDGAYRHRGYAREAVRALCAWAFERGARRVTAEAETDNAASEAVLTACGFCRVGPGVEGDRWELFPTI